MLACRPSWVCHPTSRPTSNESWDFTQTCKRSSMTQLCSHQEMILKKNIEENGSPKNRFYTSPRKLCIHVFGCNFYKLPFWGIRTKVTFLGDSSVKWCHSIFHPEIDSTYVCWTQQVTEHGEITNDFCICFSSFLPVKMWQKLLATSTWRTSKVRILEGSATGSKKKSHMFDINLWWTLSKSPSPGYKPATIGRNQCYEQNGCCIFVFNRKAATSENCPPNHLNWYSTTGQWCCKSM